MATKSSAPLAAQLIDQVNHNVKPEEARHVLLELLAFHPRRQKRQARSWE
jgi:hypothetical protein